MAGGMDLGSGGGRDKKRSLDAALNLVPFIDFLSVLISFLLVSAVWTQLSRINVATAHEPGADATPITSPREALVITIQDSGFLVENGPIEKTQIARSGVSAPKRTLRRSCNTRAKPPTSSATENPSSRP